MIEDKPISLFVDSPNWSHDINIDDFIITIGVNKSNSVYHVAEVKTQNRGRIKRSYVKCYRSDLLTAIRRDSTQKIIPMTWYKRNKT